MASKLALSDCPAYFLSEMSEARCVTCGATLIPGTGFCRQCGAPAVADLEEPTALLDQHGQPGDGTTRRLDPRPTNPYQESSSEKVPATGRNGRLIFVGVVAVAVLACVTIVGVVRSVMNKKQSAAPAIHVTRTLMYPAVHPPSLHLSESTRLTPSTGVRQVSDGRGEQPSSEADDCMAGEAEALLLG